jgi:hypothetical protein
MYVDSFYLPIISHVLLVLSFLVSPAFTTPPFAARGAWLPAAASEGGEYQGSLGHFRG